VLLLAASALLWVGAPRAPLSATRHASTPLHWLAPLAGRRFRWLFAVFAVNGIAAAIPATLFMFFVADRLGLPGYAGLFLLLYFGAAVLALPLWSRVAARMGESRAWLAAMLLAIAAFGWTATLSTGDLTSFTLVCLLTGATLGADLALPPALLAGVIGKAGDAGAREGSYFGLWSWMTKMNLALAAGITLPLLDALGYAPGSTNEAALGALTAAYALLPCALKTGAAWLLWRAPLHDV
jgi:Na+/melibiose symporter-like transporter